jgi:hypothetical protein
MAFSFRFKDDGEQYNNGKKFVQGFDALEFAKEKGYLHTRDRGALAVALFKGLHKGDLHYKKEKVEKIQQENPDKLKKMVLALIQESEERWPKRGKAHKFYKQLKEYPSNPNLIKQIRDYGIDYPVQLSAPNKSILVKEAQDGDIPSDAEIEAAFETVCQRDGTEEASIDDVCNEIEQQAQKAGRRLNPDWLIIKSPDK